MFDAVPPQFTVPLMQSHGYARAARLLGLTVEEIAFSRQGMRAGHALMQARWLPLLGWFGLISRGPLWSDLPDAGLLAEELRKLGHPVVVNADGLLPHDLRGTGFLPLMSAASIAQLDLSGDEGTRRARMHQKWRNRLTRAEDGLLKVLRAPMPDTSRHWLLEAEQAQRKSMKYKGLPGAFVAAFARANPGMAQLFTAHLNGETVAAMLFLRHGASATYHIGHTNAAGRKHHAHNLLLARACDWLAQEGVDMLDLGMIDTVNAPGLARFKLGSGALSRELGGTWLYERRVSSVVKLFG